VDVFVVTWPQLFVEPDDANVGADGEVTYDTVSVNPTVPFLFALPLLAGAGDRDLEELIVILPDPNLTSQTVMAGIVGTDTAEQIDDDHFMLTDAEGETQAEALNFSSNRGAVVELRIHVPDSAGIDIRRALAERVAAISSAKPLLVMEEDFATSTFDVRSIEIDGTLGPAERIIYSLD